MSHIGNYTKSRISSAPINSESSEYLNFKKTIPSFIDQAVYIYSFKHNRMLYAQGWKDILGYEDDEISLLTLVSITSLRFSDFSQELNDKALLFINSRTENLEQYSFTLETEKIHKNGTVVPLFSRVGVHKVENGMVSQIIGVSQVIKTLKYGEVMQYSVYGPDTSGFEESLNENLFRHLYISKKEKEALEYAAKGLAFKEIANKLGVSKSAIEKRILPLYKRFDVRSLPHLINFAHENHII